MSHKSWVFKKKHGVKRVWYMQLYVAASLKCPFTQCKFHRWLLMMSDFQQCGLESTCQCCYAVLFVRLLILSSTGSLHPRVSMKQPSTHHLLMLDGDKKPKALLCTEASSEANNSKWSWIIWEDRWERGMDGRLTRFKTGSIKQVSE